MSLLLLLQSTGSTPSNNVAINIFIPVGAQCVTTSTTERSITITDSVGAAVVGSASSSSVIVSTTSSGVITAATLTRSITDSSFIPVGFSASATFTPSGDLVVVANLGLGIAGQSSITISRTTVVFVDSGAIATIVSQQTVAAVSTVSIAVGSFGETSTPGPVVVYPDVSPNLSTVRRTQGRTRQQVTVRVVAKPPEIRARVTAQPVIKVLPTILFDFEADDEILLCLA